MERPALEEPPVTSTARPWPSIGYWTRAALAVAAVVVGLWMVGMLLDTILIVVASFALATGLQPAVKWLERRGIKRALALGAILLGGLLITGGLVGLLLPLVVAQVDDVIAQVPGYIKTLQTGDGLLARLVSMLELDRIGDSVSGDPEMAIGALGNMTSFAVNTLTLLVVTPYFALEMPAIKRWFVRLLRPQHREDFLYALNRASDLIANYIVGNLAISLMAGAITYVGLSLIGVPYALALAAWVALTDLIPMLGALIGAIPVAIVSYLAGPRELIWAMLLIVAYQQFENFVIAPRVMRRAVDLSPATVIIALLVGGQLAGLIGALLALPLAALTKILLHEFYIEERMERLRAEVTSPEINHNGRRKEKRVLP